MNLELLSRWMTFKLFAFLLVEALAFILMYQGKIADVVWGWVAVAAIASFFGAEVGEEFINRGKPPQT